MGPPWQLGLHIAVGPGDDRLDARLGAHGAAPLRARRHPGLRGRARGLRGLRLRGLRGRRRGRRRGAARLRVPARGGRAEGRRAPRGRGPDAPVPQDSKRRLLLPQTEAGRAGPGRDLLLRAGRGRRVLEHEVVHHAPIASSAGNGDVRAAGQTKHVRV